MLTAKKVAYLKEPGRYSDGHGLYLNVVSATNRSWLFRYQLDRRERWMGLGPLHTFSLAEARERARKARQLLADGTDPLTARAAEKAERSLAASKALTFGQCAEAYFEGNLDRWTPKTRGMFMSSLKRFAMPTLGDLPVAEIDVGHVLKVLEPIWRSKNETANRVRHRIETVLDWARVRGYRTGDNPARWRGFLSTQLAPRGKVAAVQHHPALPFDEVAAFFAELQRREGTAARALEFLILTASRTTAVLGATWDEIDFEDRTWTVPPDRAGVKIAGTEPRRVPLCDQAIKLLRALLREQGNPHLFIGSRKGAHLSNMALLVLLKRMDMDRITVHGFRSTFRDWVSERTSYPPHVAEAALWHAVSDKVEAAYRRGDLFEKRRRLMADWARFCYRPAERGAKVVSIRGRS